jgi:hypothetical protein
MNRRESLRLVAGFGLVEYISSLHSGSSQNFEEMFGAVEYNLDNKGHDSVFCREDVIEMLKLPVLCGAGIVFGLLGIYVKEYIVRKKK